LDIKIQADSVDIGSGGMRDGNFGIAPMQALMNKRLIEAEDGFVVFSAVPEEKHYNPHGSVHGAFATAILDSAMGLAVVTKLPAGIRQTTVEFKLSFTRPMSSETGEVRGEGRVSHCGRSIAIAEGASAWTRWQAHCARNHDLHDFSASVTPTLSGPIFRHSSR
jgi:uncharacterized protein (TIGR00369 family)